MHKMYILFIVLFAMIYPTEQAGIIAGHRCPPGQRWLINRCIRQREVDEILGKDSDYEIVEITTPKYEEQPATCILPDLPLHGTYTMPGRSDLYPGAAADFVYLTYSCDDGYNLVGPSLLYCMNGTWSSPQKPQCVSTCKLNKHPSIEYSCLLGDTFVECNDHVLSGNTVIPSCRSPFYYYPSVLPLMQCIDGVWNYVAMCLPECGKITSKGDQLVAGGRSAKRGELPWHVGIYTKIKSPYKQICGGTIVSNTVVITAAHCFWSDIEKLLPASQFAVAVGKLYRPWDSPLDMDAQKSDVREIKIPSRFQGAAANFQEDIALVVVASPFVYKTNVMPVCVDFDYNFERVQLHEGKLGKVAGWGFTEENGNPSQILKVASIPYVEISNCLSRVSHGYRGLITSDKICAGYTNGTAVCRGDSGGGLAFLETERGGERYFLRGVVSTAPDSDKECNVFTLTGFTWVIRHELFIRRHFV